MITLKDVLLQNKLRLFKPITVEDGELVFNPRYIITKSSNGQYLIFDKEENEEYRRNLSFFLKNYGIKNTSIFNEDFDILDYLTSNSNILNVVYNDEYKFNLFYTTTGRYLLDKFLPLEELKENVLDNSQFYFTDRKIYESLFNITIVSKEKYEELTKGKEIYSNSIKILKKLIDRCSDKYGNRLNLDLSIIDNKNNNSTIRILKIINDYSIDNFNKTIKLFYRKNSSHNIKLLNNIMENINVNKYKVIISDSYTIGDTEVGINISLEDAKMKIKRLIIENDKGED